MATIRILILFIVMLTSAVANPTFVLPQELHSGSQDVGNVCPGTKTSCASGSGYGCCPLENAVCCSDGIHCCPEGHTCDTSNGKCLLDGFKVSDMLKKQPAVSAPPSDNVVCPDGNGECKGDQTCCIMSSGRYGCCPRPNAVCCSDGVHCCPENTNCNSSDNTCTGTNSLKVSDMLKKQPALPKPPSDGNIVCPDGKSACSSDQTCCKTVKGEYGCCPVPKAVCCSDDIHCCPEGTTCDDREGKCLNSSSTKIMHLKETQAVPLVKMAATSSVIEDDYNVCPNNKERCVGRCCTVGTGKDVAYMCCDLPYSNSQCCSASFRYCCPSGYHCVMKDSSINCEKSDSTIDTWYDQTKGLL